MRSVVVFNPTKLTDEVDVQSRVLALLTRAGWPAPEWVATTVDDGGYGQATQALSAGAEVIFACGGDGTVRECARSLIGKEARLAILPMGTANLLARALELPLELEACVEIAIHGHTRALDVGLVDKRIFVVMAGMGLDAQMVAGTSETLKRRFGWIAYVATALSALFDHRMRLEIQIDDGRPFPARARSVLIGNTGELPGGARLTDAKPDDGHMSVAVITARSAFDWVRIAWGLLLRRPRIPRVEVFGAQSVRLSCRDVLPRQLDGDSLPPAREMHARLLPGAVRVYGPAASA